MQYAKVENGTVVQVGLPTTGVLSDGRSVSGYHLLDEETLLNEGWLPIEENKPVFDPETQRLQLMGYEVQADKVIANYLAIDIPVPSPTPEQRIAQLEAENLIALEAVAEVYELVLAFTEGGAS